jgi:uncharacterized protein
VFLFPRGVQAMVERYRMLERERRERSSAQRALLRGVAAGAYGLEHFTEADVDRATQIIDRYADLRIGLADASIVVVVEWVDTLGVLTLDERHFRTVTGPGGRASAALK